MRPGLRASRGRRNSIAAASFGLYRDEGKIMADDRSKAGQADRLRINVNEDYERRDWSKSLGVTPERLKDTVKAVGPMAEDVRRHLGKA